MHKFIEYALLFVVMVLLQVFFFSRIGISMYVCPLVYVAFVLLLPMEIHGVLLLLLAALTGITMDFFMGTSGLHTIATVFMAFCRPTALNLLVGKDEVKEGGVPNVNRLGRKKFLRYAAVLIFLHSLVFFSLESLSWSFYYLTLLRVILSSGITFLLVWFGQRLFVVNRPQQYGNQ